MGKRLISVIDDDESVRRTTKRLIESFGFRTAALEPAENFLGSGHLNDTSCLIVSVQLPGMKGLQLHRQLAAADCQFQSFSSPLTMTKNPVGEQCKPALSRFWETFYRRAVTPMDSFSLAARQRRHENNVITES